MKVVLLTDVKGQGKAGDVIDVSDGYARNFLLKNNLAKEGNAVNINAANIKKEAEAHRKLVEKQQAQELAAKLKGQKVTVKVKAGEKGRVFGSISSQQISDALNTQGFSISKQQIVLPQPIKQVGEYKIEAKLYAGVTATFEIVVIAE